MNCFCRFLQGTGSSKNILRLKKLFSQIADQLNVEIHTEETLIHFKFYSALSILKPNCRIEGGNLEITDYHVTSSVACKDSSLAWLCSDLNTVFGSPILYQPYIIGRLNAANYNEKQRRAARSTQHIGHFCLIMSKKYVALLTILLLTI